MMQLKRYGGGRECTAAERAPATCYASNGGDGVGWSGWLSVFAEKKETPTNPPPRLPDILPPSLPLAPFPFSETDRTREACESKDERPVREVRACVCVRVVKMCVCV